MIAIQLILSFILLWVRVVIHLILIIIDLSNIDIYESKCMIFPTSNFSDRQQTHLNPLFKTVQHFRYRHYIIDFITKSAISSITPCKDSLIKLAPGETMAISAWDISNVRVFKAFYQCGCLYFLHRGLRRWGWKIGAILVRVAQLAMWVTTPRETVTSTRRGCGRVEILRCCDHKSLVTATDNFFDEKIIQSLHSLRQWVFDHSPGTRMMRAEAVCGNLPSFLFREAWGYHFRCKVLLDGWRTSFLDVSYKDSTVLVVRVGLKIHFLWSHTTP